MSPSSSCVSIRRGRVVCRYGRNQGWANVTEIMQQHVKQSMASEPLVVSNALFGDPSPGVVKVLLLDFEMHGRARSKAIREHDPIVFTA